MLRFQNSRLGPGAIGKVLIEALDPSTGSYTNASPIFELNLHLSEKHCIGFGEIDHLLDEQQVGRDLFFSPPSLIECQQREREEIDDIICIIYCFECVTRLISLDSFVAMWLSSLIGSRSTADH